MENLIELIGKQLTPEVVNALSGVSGASPAQTQGALQAAVPTLVGALAKNGSSPTGAQQILDLVGKQTGSADLLGNIPSLLSDPNSSQNLLSSGAGIVGSLFGGDPGKAVDLIASTAGITNSTANILLRSVAPIAVAVLGKVVSGGNLNASGLSNLLAGQADFIKAAAPKGLADVLGVGNFTGSTQPAPAASVPPTPPVQTPVPPQQRSLRWLWWLIGILILLALLWYLFLRPQPQASSQLPAEVQAPAWAAQTVTTERSAVGEIQAGLLQGFNCT